MASADSDHVPEFMTPRVGPTRVIRNRVFFAIDAIALALVPFVAINLRFEGFRWPPGIAATVDHDVIRHAYWTSLRKLNPSGIVPLGPLPNWAASHGRG